MINRDFDIARLIAKHLSGEITPEERTQLETWQKENVRHQDLFRKVCDELNYKQHVEKQKNFDVIVGWNEINRRIKAKKRRALCINVLRYAAIILLPVLFVTLSVQYNSVSPSLKHDKLATTMILPGEAKAILTLDDGQTIFLNKSATDSQQIQLSNSRIQVDSTTLSYRLAKKAVVRSSSLIYNKVEIPSGGEYSLVLNDGTKVCLNSMSSLRFPVVFSADKREVELTGEAYFEVSSSKQPFIVHTKGMQIEVLGTTFNISAYSGEESHATVVSGSVKVHSDKGASLILKPSQQALLSENGEMQMRTVDLIFYTSWVKGKIYFKDQRLEDIMKTLSRWYGIEVKYANESVKNIRFGCHVDRYSEITPFVELLEATKNVKININNKTITFQ